MFPTIQKWLRDSPPIDEARPAPDCPPVTFAELWEPIAAGACTALAASLPAAVEASALRDLRDELILRLSELGESTVWKHFNARRTLRDLVLAHIEADGRGCGRATYCRATEELRADGLQALTEQYPVLRRHLATAVTLWLASSRELVERVSHDHRLLADTFAFPIGARLTGIRPGLSDPHRGGRSVAILTFTSPAGKGTRAVVYKPKDLRADAAYHRLIEEVPAPKTIDESLRGLTVLVRDGYGYMEHISHEICANDIELRAFYRNAGRLTAVLYVLGCNDCHNENLIAHRDQLVLVDAETLFQSVPRRREKDRTSTLVRSDLHERILDSVVKIGLLPQWFFIGGKRTPRDVSGLGIQVPASERELGPGWIALNSDGMMSGDVERAARLPTSSPVGIGNRNRLSEFVADYCDGFACQLTAIAGAKESWLGDDGYLARFRELRSRFIRRPTWIYLWARRQACEANSLVAEADQQRVLAQLDQSSGLATEADEKALLAAEAAQLANLDIPFFEQPVAGRDVVICDGAALSGYFARSGLQNAERKVELLNDAEIQLQLALIRGVLAAKDLRAHQSGPPDPTLTHGLFDVPSDEERWAATAAVGAILLRTAVVDNNGGVEWLGIDAAGDAERASYGPLGPSLYGGRLGIAVFLAALARARPGEPDAEAYRKLAIGSCSDLLQLLNAHDPAVDMRRWWRDQPLGVAGSGGQLLAVLLLRDLLHEFERPIAAGLSALLGALDSQLLRDDEDLDVVFGCAGLIGPLLKIGTSSAIALARAAGDRLVDRQDESGGWILASIGSKPLTGFSHGASGMLAALARLGAATGHDAYLDAAARALHYERRQFDPGEGNWPDLRGHGQEHTAPAFMVSWCHGAPGIALARLCLSRTPLWDAHIEQDLQHALPPTTDATLPEDCICCGRFGRAAILRAASESEGDQRWRGAAEQLEAQGLVRKRSVGNYSFGDVFGLFQGAAGVGLALVDGMARGKASLVPAILSAGLLE